MKALHSNLLKKRLGESSRGKVIGLIAEKVAESDLESAMERVTEYMNVRAAEKPKVLPLPQGEGCAT